LFLLPLWWTDRPFFKFRLTTTFTAHVKLKFI
jgi:hypothetical protein